VRNVIRIKHRNEHVDVKERSHRVSATSYPDESSLRF
jgi:hypothetical protein